MRDPIDPDDCLHPGRPKTPRMTEIDNIWHCDDCDTSFVVEAVTSAAWREI